MGGSAVMGLVCSNGLFNFEMRAFRAWLSENNYG